MLLSHFTLTLHAPELYLYRTQCTCVRLQSHIFLLLLILHKTAVPYLGTLLHEHVLHAKA